MPLSSKKIGVKRKLCKNLRLRILNSILNIDPDPKKNFYADPDPKHWLLVIFYC